MLEKKQTGQLFPSLGGEGAAMFSFTAAGHVGTTCRFTPAAADDPGLTRKLLIDKSRRRKKSGGYPIITNNPALIRAQG